MPTMTMVFLACGTLSGGKLRVGRGEGTGVAFGMEWTRELPEVQ